jgi:pyrimidine operon attenuation protein/uracil phosphoribosyltransferase
MNEEEIASRLEGLADEIALRMPPSAKPALVGIQRRGVYLAGRLAGLLAGRLGRELPQGSLDINLYRDDWTTLGPKATVGRTSLNFDLPGRTLILVDDVLYTGRTVRAALEALADFGRPGKVELLALVDRGGRELPIHADYAGLTLHTSDDEQVDVLLRELDGQDQVLLHKKS